ncbi:undecaprenyl-phosphate glucose phosphotransferase [Paraburkholderia dipogonis]|uniref:Undecaprenyl-phosphate glucose phosphotransferase n=1 Tax=Paraburkholderia dipogonis TaxID=1211383 RepID=A0A4Y8MT62_9BURK|nr:undecaprenyl-phosphate glucose phosphotransferase [Paraburkholderia dipogonis]TFE40609.1 undecaprenyl-phosphate glucose phosphotransferase [Paraburkholderia dipogonis]
MQSVKPLGFHPGTRAPAFLFALLDACFVLAGAAIAYVFRFDDFTAWSDPTLLLVAFNTAMTVLLFPTLGIYQSWRGRSPLEMVTLVTIGWVAVFVLGLVLVFTTHQAHTLSRLWCGTWLVTSLVLFVGLRLAKYQLSKQLWSRGINVQPVAIVGANPLSLTLIDRLRKNAQSGFSPECVFDEDPLASKYAGGLPVVASLDGLADAVRTRGIKEIWLVLPLREEARVHAVLNAFRHDFVNVRFIPNVRDFSLFNHSVSEVVGLSAINLLASPSADPRFVPKQIFDRTFAALALLCLLPPMLVIGILVKLSSPGPVFFRQWRKGANGNEFQIYKFRTMVVHSEDAGQLTQAKRRDPRVTPIGALLRKTSLDELPQFINVLKGDMSVVGPRPHALQHDELYKDLVHGYMFRYRIKPGITGWAQINGYRGETDKIEKMQGRIAFDLYYIENWTFGLDLKIVLKTFIHGFSGAHAY